MRIAITGGTGFVGRHLAHALASDGHETVLIARGVEHISAELRQLAGATFVAAGVDDEDKLIGAFKGCDAVAHCAGINRETGEQTYHRVHVEGTQCVVNAAKRVGAKKVMLLSFLRARANSGSAYHETKWEAEEIVRSSGLDYTILKAGIIYGRGDHMLSHMKQAVRMSPLFATVGIKERMIRPVAVEDLAAVIKTALVEGKLSRQTVSVVGPEELKLSEAVRRVARVLGKRVYVFPLPVVFHRALAWCAERVMKTPLVATSQVSMLAEGISETPPDCERLPDELAPQTFFTAEQIRRGLVETDS